MPSEQETYQKQRAREVLDALTREKMLVLMHVQLGSPENLPIRQVATTLITRAGKNLWVTSCAFLQQAADSAIVFTDPPEIPASWRWGHEVIEKLLQRWTEELPWGALLKEPRNPHDPLSSIRVVVSRPKSEGPVEAGLKAFLDFLIVYGALISRIGSLKEVPREQEEIKKFLQRLEGLRSAVIRVLGQQLKEVHKMRM